MKIFRTSLGSMSDSSVQRPIKTKGPSSARDLIVSNWERHAYWISGISVKAAAAPWPEEEGSMTRLYKNALVGRASSL